jgi:hypothetical protein
MLHFNPDAAAGAVAAGAIRVPLRRPSRPSVDLMLVQHAFSAGTAIHWCHYAMDIDTRLIVSCAMHEHRNGQPMGSPQGASSAIEIALEAIDGYGIADATVFSSRGPEFEPIFVEVCGRQVSLVADLTDMESVSQAAIEMARGQDLAIRVALAGCIGAPDELVQVRDAIADGIRRHNRMPWGTFAPLSPAQRWTKMGKPVAAIGVNVHAPRVRHAAAPR